MKKILLIESSGAPVFVDRYRFLKKMGYKLVVVRHSLNDEAKKLVDHFIPVYTHNFEKMDYAVRTIVQKAKEIEVDGIMTRWDAGVPIMASVSQNLGFRTIPPESAQILRYKHEMKYFFKDKGLPTSEFLVVNTLQEGLGAAEKIGYPIVLKPSLGYGSWGVTMIKSEIELKEKFKRILNLSIQEFVSDQLLIEEYLQGPELNVDSIVYQGKVIFANICEKPLIDDTQGFAEVEFITPSRFNEGEIDKILSINQLLVEELGIYNSVLHVEMRLTAQGPKILEINPRLGGGKIPTIIKMSSGVDLELAAIKLALNERPEVNVNREVYSGFRVIYPTKSGILQSVKGLDKARMIQNVTEIEFTKREGEPVYTLPYFIQEQLGYIVAEGKHRDEVLQALDSARECVELKVTKRS